MNQDEMKLSRPWIMFQSVTFPSDAVAARRHLPSMKSTRRKFLAASSTALVATQLSSTGRAAAAPAGDPAKLAKEGGAKAVLSAPQKWVRWDEREQKQLAAALAQSSIFYWGGRTTSPQTTLLVERFKQHCPRDYVATCSSGTAAIHVAVAAAGVGPGDEVITTPITDIGTVTGILFQQGVPVFADLGAATYNLDPAAVERAITPRTKAILTVHLTGNPCDLTALRALADRRGLVLIEDCAQAWGARYRGKPVGTQGHVACFSLQGSKHVTAGDGGLVASSDPRIGPALVKFADKGFDRMNPAYVFEKTDVLATNYRMTELQAAFAAAQMQRLEGIAEKRAALGRALISEISGLPGVIAPRVEAEDRSVFWFFYLRLVESRLRCKRAEFVEALRAEGAPCSAGYIKVPLYRLPYFQQHSFFAGRWPVKELGLTTMDYTQVRCPEAEAILADGVMCTLNESMTETYVREVGAAIRKVAKHYAA